MKIEEAIKIISEVCALYKGSLSDHQMLQTALSTIKNKINKNEEDKLENDKDK